jgi:hypothetical protein
MRHRFVGASCITPLQPFVATPSPRAGLGRYPQACTLWALRASRDDLYTSSTIGHESRPRPRPTPKP